MTKETRNQLTECNFRRQARSWSFLLHDSVGIPILWNLDPKLVLLEGETVHRLVDMTSQEIAEACIHFGWMCRAVAGPSLFSFRSSAHPGVEEVILDMCWEVSEEFETLEATI